MKYRTLLYTVLAGGLCAGYGIAADLPANDKSVKEEAPKLSHEEQIKYLQSFGWLVGKQSGLETLGLSAEEQKAFIEGLQLMLNGKEAPVEFSRGNRKVFDFLQQKAAAYEPILQKKRQEEAEKNKIAGTAFLENLEKTDKDVKKTASGLRYKIAQQGEATPPKNDEIVLVKYEGKRVDGVVFDSTTDRGGEAQQIPLESVFPGFREGIQLIGKGGKITLYIPAELAYGPNPLPGLPGGSLLIFNVELIDIKAKETPKQYPLPPKGEAPKSIESPKPAEAQKTETQPAAQK